VESLGGNFSALSPWLGTRLVLMYFQLRETVILKPQRRAKAGDNWVKGKREKGTGSTDLHIDGWNRH